MKIFESITSGYKKIAAGIAIVSFLAIMYMAMIPGIVPHIVASAGIFDAQSGMGIGGAKVKIVEWPLLWNTTTSNEVATLGNYSLNGVSYNGTDPNGTTYTVRVIKPGYGPDSKKVTLNTTKPDATVNFDLLPSDPSYVPFVYDYNLYNTQIQVFNPYDFNITVANTAYMSGNKSKDYEITPQTLNSINASNVWGGDIVGSEKVETTRPAKVQGLIMTKATGVYSIAPSRNVSAETVTYLPFVYDYNLYDSAVQIFNPDPVNSIISNITIYSTSGVTKNLSMNIAPLTLGSTYAEVIFGGDVIGTIKVESTGPALVQGNIRTIGTKAFSIAPSTNRSAYIQYIPFVYDYNLYDSAVQIFNPDPVNSIIANVTIYSTSGVTKNLSIPIAPLTLGSSYAETIFGGDVIGTMKIETTGGPALVQANIRTIASKTFSIAPAMTIPDVATVFIPYLKDIGADYDSAIQIFNPYPTDTINATITSYNLLNGQTKTYYLNIPPLTLGSQYAEVVANGDFEGSVKVETKVDGSPRPALVQANIRTKVGNVFTVATSVQ